MSRILVTGGAGFIGSNLARELVRRGSTVRVLDDLSSGDRQNLADLDVDFLEGDVRDVATVARAVDGCDGVLHLAAIASVTRSVDDPCETHAVNLNGTLNVLAAAREAGVKRVVFAGSSAIYGDSEALPKVETMPPEPLSPYALHKLAGEQYGRLYTDLFGLEVATVRYFNIFGARQDPSSDYAAVIPKFIALMLKGTAPTIFGDGTQTRDFCHVDNAVDATLRALESPAAAGGVYNIGCGQAISLLRLVDAINEVLGTRIEATLGDPRPGDILHSYADISAARRDLGYAPDVSMTEGLRRTARWYREIVP